MKLPGGERAIVELTKLRDYCLNPNHVRGRHKARVFAAVLGLGSSDAGFLRRQLLVVAREGDAKERHHDEFGRRYSIDFELEHGSRRAPVRSAWIVSGNDEVPRLTSCYVLLDEVENDG